MLSINKTYCWLFVIAILIQIPNVHFVKFADELLVALMMCLVGLDMLINHQLKKYKLLWIIAGIMAIYALYSVVFMSYNTPVAVVHDYIAQMKPFCYFCISYAIVPKFDASMRNIAKGACMLNSAIALVCVITGTVQTVFFHVSYMGLVSMISFLVYLFCSTDENGKVGKTDLMISVAMLTIGLASTRSKFYGEYVMALYMLFMYTPGFAKNIKLKHVLAFVFAAAMVVVVAWGKIEYYFLAEAADMEFDEEALQTIARPMLYAGMAMLLALHPLLGSGLASFATNASSTAVNYSEAYRTIGLDSVWGLSPSFDSFICDAFYPSLAQFGLVGIGLFVYFFVWIYKRLSLVLRLQGKVYYLIGVMSIVVVLIESVAATTFNQGAGAMCMMILGCIVSSFRARTKKELEDILMMPYKDTAALQYIRNEK